LSRRVVRVAFVAITAVGATAGCYSQQYAGDRDPASCEAVDGALSPSLEADVLAGEYRLVVVATEGTRAGESVSGALSLVPTPDGMRELLDPSAGMTPREGVSVPLFGTADLDVDAVGGVIAGGLASDDPQRPGAMVVEDRTAEGQPPQLFIRLGSEGNDRTRQRFDGAYFALVVTAVEADAMHGSWTSGLETMQAGGHFCAYR
jgi:hypothetical protein